MFNLQEYRTIVQGMQVTIAELENTAQTIDKILTSPITEYNRLELIASREDFKAYTEMLSTALVEFRKRVNSDKDVMVRGINAAKRSLWQKRAGIAASTGTEQKSPDPIYCPECGMLADTFCECGFHSPEKGAA